MLTIQVTECRVYPNPVEDARLKAFASITLNGCFVVTDMKIIDGNGGLFVAMPAKPRKDGVYRDQAYPITRELREHIEEVVLDEYRREVSQRHNILAGNASLWMARQYGTRCSQRMVVGA